MKTPSAYLLCLLCLLTAPFLAGAQLNFALVENEEKLVGIVDQYGNEIVAPSYRDIKPFSNEMAVVRKGDYWGAINIKGELVVPCKYRSIQPFDETGTSIATITEEYILANGLNPKADKGKKMIISSSGKQLCPTLFSSISKFETGVAIGTIDDRKVFIKRNGSELNVKLNGNVILPKIRKFSNGIAIVEFDGKIGFCDTTGNVIIPFQFQKAYEFMEDQSLVLLNGKWGVINKEGEFIIEAKYDKLTHLENGYRIFYQKGLKGVISKEGKEVVEAKYHKLIRASETKWQTLIDGEGWGIVSNQNEYKPFPKDIVKIYKFENGYAVARHKKSEKLGIISHNAEWVVEAKYDDLKNLHNGMAKGLIDSEKSWRYVSPSGLEIKIEGANQLADYGYFEEGLASVKVGGKIGFINKKGNWILEPRFDVVPFKRGAMQFNKGISIVRKDGLYGLINTNGNWILKPKYRKIETFEKVQSKQPEHAEQTSIRGYFKFRELKSDIPSGVMVYLLNDEGEIVYSTTTDNQGYFSFKNLDPDIQYFLKVDETDTDFELVILGDNNDNTIAVMSNDNSGMFLYHELSYEQISGLNLLYTPDIGLVNITKSFNGQFRYKYLTNESIEGLTVHLVDDEGNIIYTTTTDAQGVFAFKELPFDQNYVVKLEEYNPGIELMALNDNGIVAELSMNKKAEFRFVKLSKTAINNLQKLHESDAAMYTDQSSVLVQFKHKYVANSYIGKTKVLLKNSLGKVLGAGITDSKGRVYFNHVVINERLSFELDLGADTNTINLEFTNGAFESIAVIASNDAVFYYSFLAGDIPFSPAQIMTEDINLKINEGEVHIKSINEDALVIYFGINSAEYNYDGKDNLNALLTKLKDDKKIKVDISAYSDKTGTAVHNKDLSIKRAQTVENYFLQNGVPKNRITYRGFGATNFAVTCTTCSEDENQLNRRAVVRLK